jgi:hypothetical protein
MAYKDIPYDTQGWMKLLSLIRSKISQAYSIVQSVRRLEIDADRKYSEETGSVTWPIDERANTAQREPLEQIMEDIADLASFGGFTTETASSVEGRTSYGYVIKPGRPEEFTHVTITADYADVTDNFIVESDGGSPFSEVIDSDTVGDHIGFRFWSPYGGLYEDDNAGSGFLVLAASNADHLHVREQTNTKGYFTELILNGTFDTASEWDITGHWQFNTDHMETDGNPTDGTITQTADKWAMYPVAGVPYRLGVNVTRSAGSLSFSLNGQEATTTCSSTKTYTYTFVLTDAQAALRDEGSLVITGDAFEGEVDNVSLSFDCDGTHTDFEIYLVERDF